MTGTATLAVYLTVFGLLVGGFVLAVTLPFIRWNP